MESMTSESEAKAEKNVWAVAHFQLSASLRGYLVVSNSIVMLLEHFIERLEQTC